MKGPCLCGDPHCPNCGDVGQAAYETAMEDLQDTLDEQIRGLDARPEFVNYLSKHETLGPLLRVLHKSWVNGWNAGFSDGKESCIE